MNVIEKLIRPDLREFARYRSARDESKERGVLLDANEMPWGILNRYPNQQPDKSLGKIGDYYQVSNDQILVTRGSGEAIDCIIRLFCEAYQSSILVVRPTFGLYAVSAQLQGADVIAIDLGLGEELRYADIEHSIKGNTKVVFICSPNNPTGKSVQTTEIMRLCERLKDQCIVVVDEAYIEFSEQDSMAFLLSEYANLIVLRTLSKAFAMASARVGVLLSNAFIVQSIKNILAPYPLTRATINSIETAFCPVQINKMKEHVQRVVTERERVVLALREIPLILRVWDSDANFFFVESSVDIKSLCEQADVLIRDMSSHFPGRYFTRITIGNKDENDQLLNALGVGE